MYRRYLRVEGESWGPKTPRLGFNGLGFKGLGFEGLERGEGPHKIIDVSSAGDEETKQIKFIQIEKKPHQV